MGYGGIIKTVFRVAASVVGNMVCGPPCAAIGSAVATGATGGSFKEALMAGATSYVGAKIGQGITKSINQATTEVAQNAALNELPTTFIDSAGNVTEVLSGGTIPQGFAGAGTELTGNIVNTGLTDAALASLGESVAPINKSITEFGSEFGNTLKETFGIVDNVNRSAFDIFSENAQKAIGALGFDTTPVPFDIVGSTVGGATSFTLNQALLEPTGAFDEILGQKFTPEQILALKREARNAMSQRAFDELTANTVNPFGDTPEGIEEFNRAIAAGIERENVDLGRDITQEQFDARFDTPNLGDIFLQEEQGIRQQGFNEDLGQTFTGDAFGKIDDDIINSIVDERSGAARQQVSNFQARGNFNPTGGSAANDTLTNQVESARNRVRQEGDTILGGTQQRINTLGDQARGQISNFKLGDDLFDVTPFQEQRQELIDEQQGSLGSDIRTSLGSAPIFDINSVLQAGGRAQGQVSGQTGNQAFLDTIAERQGGVNRTDQRGIGSRGSGIF